MLLFLKAYAGKGGEAVRLLKMPFHFAFLQFKTIGTRIRFGYLVVTGGNQQGFSGDDPFQPNAR